MPSALDHAGPTPSRLDPSLPLVAGGLLMGTLGLFLEQAGQHPLTAVLFRCGFGAAAVAFFAALVGRSHELRVDAGALRAALLAGALMVLMWASFFTAITWTSIAVATVVFHVQPLLTLLAAVWLFGEAWSRRRALGALLALLGLAAATGLAQGSAATQHPRFLAGLALALFGAACYTVVTLLAQRRRVGSTLAFTFWQCVAGTMLLAWWPWAHALADRAAAWPAATWLWLAGLGVLHTGLAYALMYGAMQRLAAARIAVLQFVYPITAILIDTAIFGRPLTALQWAGVLLMGAALWWSGRERSGG
jgi:drug/metabolite transporter (DMT)-like permease